MGKGLELGILCTSSAQVVYNTDSFLLHKVWHVNVKIHQPGYLQRIPNAIPIFQTQTVDLGIFEENGSGWVSKHEGRSLLHALVHFTRWTTDILLHHEDTLKAASIYDAV